MKKPLIVLKTVALSFLLGFISCQKDIPEEDGNVEQKEEIADKPFKSGVMLSYLVKETSFSTGTGKSDLEIMAGKSINSEEKEVSVYFDSKKENYQITTRRLDKVKDKDFIEPEWREKVETNSSSTRYSDDGEVLSSMSSMEKGSNDLSYMIAPYPERSKMMKKMLSNLNTGSKSNNLSVEVQSDTNVVKISKTYHNDIELGKEMDGYTAVSYINTKYGIPVVSELYDPSRNLTSKVTILYKMIDNIPVVAYEESISYTKDSNGSTIEHKAITKYENINITNF